MASHLSYEMVALDMPAVLTWVSPLHRNNPGYRSLERLREATQDAGRTAGAHADEKLYWKLSGASFNLVTSTPLGSTLHGAAYGQRVLGMLDKPG